MIRSSIGIREVFLIAGVIAMGGTGALAADSSDGALATQSSTMNTLTATRGEGAVSGRISTDFSAFAGSSANADALVTGLRNGTAITLTTTDAMGASNSTTFTPPTTRMGYGNVYTSLALAKQQLAELGITQPTAQQIEAALVGGPVTGSSGQATQLTGILQLRSQGMGWGQIANTLGYKLGPIISSMRSANARVAQSPVVTSGTTAATGGSASAPKSGIVTGTGGGAANTGASGSGQGHAYGRGIVTGAGTPAGAGTGAGQGHAYGKGIVSGAGGAGGQGVAAGGAGKGASKGN